MKKFIFSEPTRADLRRLDCETAMRIFAGLHSFAETGQRDLKRLKAESGEFGLRVGDYRVRFTEELATLHISRVLHRKEAYR